VLKYLSASARLSGAGLFWTRSLSMQKKLGVLIGVAMGLLWLSACEAQPTPAAKNLTTTAASTAAAPALPTTSATMVSTLPAGDRTTTVQRGTIRAAVNATGKTASAKEVKLGFGVSGTVQDILINEGQAVKAGDVLARLNTDALELAVKRAEQTLAHQQLAYSLVITPTRADVAAARAALASANANLAVAQGAPDPRQLEIARLQLAQARDVKNPTQTSVRIAELQFDLAQNGTPAQVAVAQSQVAQAQAQLDKLLQSDSRSRALAAIPLKQAELDLQEAQRRVADAQLVAPIDGVLSKLSISVGDQANAAPVATISDLSVLNVEALIDESNIGLLTAGQPAVIALTALPDQTLTGKVERIAVVPTGDTGYKVVVELDKTTAPVRSGLSASLSIIVGESNNVLVVPSWAIRTDRSTGKTYVYVKRGSQVTETEIETGLYDATQIEVKAGVAEGDVVVSPPKSGS
jgi:HlyD family secretion protein